MQVQIKHNGVDITSYVIEYHREHKICTGIGLMDITIARTVGRTFEPWDTISIYENGDFKVNYHVSSVIKDVPDSTITLECQDGSKRLVDYFIPDSYVIETPTLTRYWIEKFLAEAGINYQFTTNSQGVLLSNYTNLGLVPAYEQILQLLQMSGWYMYFDGNGIAIIGSLTTELPNAAQSYGETDILSISVITDDKMLRNRAVVWGAYDVLRGENAFADVRTQTRWNYDSNDLRAMVVSNSNIPTRNSAYGIANTLIKEFARITIEKHLTVAGASNINLGDVARVRSRAWQGSGLVTTFGVSMSKQGLITSLILDERCPRLFGFFDFGDYVYVGTFGSGVWRKRIKYDPTWYNFSTGLGDDLAVTDLHINYDMFGCVTSSGHGYYATSSDGPWLPYPIDYLTSSKQSLFEGIDTSSGILSSGVELATFSGLMTRCVIVDKVTGAIKYGVDTYSGLNWGDYFMMWSGFVLNSGTASSGLEVPSGTSASGYRSWIVEYSPITSMSGVYPVHYSGSFNMMVVDIENDGINDYISVREMEGTGIPGSGLFWNYGYKNSQAFASTSSSTSFAPTPANLPVTENNTLGFSSYSSGMLTRNSAFCIDNQTSGEIESVTVGRNGSICRLTLNKMTRTVLGQSSSFSRSTLTKDTSIPSASANSLSKILSITKATSIVYRVFYWDGVPSSSINIYYIDWNIDTNTLDTAVQILATSTNPQNSVQSSGFFSLAVNGKAYLLHCFYDGSSSTAPSNQTFVRIDMFTIDMIDSTASRSTIAQISLPFLNSSYFYVPQAAAHPEGARSVVFSTFESMKIRINQYGNELPRVIGWFEAYHAQPGTPSATFTSKEYLLTGDVESVAAAQIYENSATGSCPSRFYNTGLGDTMGESQLTSEAGVVTLRATNDGISTSYFAFNGITFKTGSGGLPNHLKYENIFPILSTAGVFIAKVASQDFKICSATSLEVLSDITLPNGYFAWKPYSTSLHGQADQVYFLLDNVESSSVLVPFTPSNGFFNTSKEYKPNGILVTSSRGVMVGCFFFSEPGASTFNGTNPLASISYVDVLIPSKAGRYLLLQRDGTDFNLIQESQIPIRADISNSSPVFSLLDRENTFKSHYITDSELLTVSTLFPVGPTPSGVRDYRYTMLELPSGLLMASGIQASGLQEELAANKIGLYLVGSGVLFTDVSTLNSGFTMIYQIPSGLAERIETSNFVASGQYIFVTTSGDYPMFYQKDPAVDVFVPYSGLPSVRATIIRVDDRF